MQQTSVLPNLPTNDAALKHRLRAALLHLAASGILAVIVALVVFEIWYPYPYREISGGRELFLLVISVDVVLGPLLTLAVFNIRKPRAELVRDIAVVALLQLSGLGYGLWTVQSARPVHLVFEVDRFRVVHRIDIPSELESRVPAGVQVAPWTGPTPLSIRVFRNESERLDMTMAALQGVQLAARPDLWEPYLAGKERILAAARPLADLRRKFAPQAVLIDDAVHRSGRGAESLSYLPMIARKAEAWTVLLDAKTAEIVGFLPLDSV
jgi:hypothetical protein